MTNRELEHDVLVERDMPAPSRDKAMREPGRRLSRGRRKALERILKSDGEDHIELAEAQREWLSLDNPALWVGDADYE